MAASKQKVLFLCVGNTARSPMAEAMLRKIAGDRFEAYSAGLRPGTEVRPEAIKVLEEIGVPTEGLRSKSVDEYLGRMHVAYTVTVCDVAERDCARSWPMGWERLFWSVPDPAHVEGDEETRLAAFRAARDDLKARIEEWVTTV